MKRMTQNLVLALGLAGVLATVKWVMPEDGEPGGYVVRVERFADIEVAERVAAKFQNDFGFEVLVAF